MRKDELTGKGGFDAGTPHVDVFGEPLSQVGLTCNWLETGIGG